MCLPIFHISLSVFFNDTQHQASKVAEAVGVVFGIISSFNQALECFRYVRIARDYVQDSDTCQLRLVLQGLRVSRWGQRVGLHTVENEELITPEEHRKLADEVLRHIIKLFKDARAATRNLPQDGPATASSTFGALHDQLQQLTLNRTNRKHKDSFAVKTVWALYKMKEPMDFLESLTGLVDSLCSFFESKETI